MLKKIAIVVQRYGLEVNGGAELHARQIAELLKDDYDIEVLTTCALDYITWKNEYNEGATNINGVIVRRFPVNQTRNIEDFNKFSQEVIFSSYNQTLLDELEWMKKQGPVCTKLITYLNDNKHNYDAILFFTYLYFTTYFGLQVAPEKSILIPTAHDEPPIYLSIFNTIFHLPKAILYNTIEEKEFINKLFNNDYIKSEIVGVGVKVPERIDGAKFIEKYNIKDDYILYIGRIDPSKGCDELFDYFIRYKKHNNSKLKLVLMGKPVMDVPNHPDIISLGFVSDEDKFNGIAASKIIVQPSNYESLSIVVLEAMKLRKPVLVNARCTVLKGHCIKSNGGLYYENYEEFEGCLEWLLNEEEQEIRLGNNSYRYVSLNYDWKVIKNKLKKMIY
jgi:glycosyltransferase involved in cell wall biosynthesis